MSDIDQSPPKKIEFDVFGENAKEVYFEDENNTSREYRYFDINDHSNSQKSVKSDKSDKEIDRIHAKHNDLGNKIQPTNSDLNYVSPEIEGRHKGRTSNDVFDYNTIRKRHSFDYSNNECQETPNKRNTRSSKNKDLLSPVTRVLGLDSNAKVTCIHNSLDFKKASIFMRSKKNIKQREHYSKVSLRFSPPDLSLFR